MRNAEIGNKDFELDVLEEAYTTEHWLVRIYKVKPPSVIYSEFLPTVSSFSLLELKLHEMFQDAAPENELTCQSIERCT